MPLYEYKCPEHGVFQELASMDDHDKPQHCPQCQAMSARIVVLPPKIALLLKETREALERNEKAQHEPDVMTAADYHQREAEKQARHAHKHGSNCGCSQRRKSNLMYTAEGNKMFPGMRPWMISH